MTQVLLGSYKNYGRDDKGWPEFLYIPEKLPANLSINFIGEKLIVYKKQVNEAGIKSRKGLFARLGEREECKLRKKKNEFSFVPILVETKSDAYEGTVRFYDYNSVRRAEMLIEEKSSDFWTKAYPVQIEFAVHNGEDYIRWLLATKIVAAYKQVAAKQISL